MFQKKVADHIYIPVAVALNTLFFYPVIFLDKTFYLRDIHRLFYPMKYFLANSLKEGAIPFWCSYYFCGSPFMSDIQAGVFYPLSIVFVLLPFPWSFNIYVVIHITLAFCFFYQFIKGLGLSKKSAIITGVSYSLGSYTISSVSTLNNLSTLIWLPAILWSFQQATGKNFKSGYFFTVLFLCMAILGGEPQLFILIVGIYILHSLPLFYSKTTNIRSNINCLLIIFILVLSAVLITFVQLGPTYTDYQYSARLGGFTYLEASRFSLDWPTLKHLVVPLVFSSDFATNPSTLNNFFPGNGKFPWLLTIYPGFIILPLALFTLFKKPSRKILVWFFTFLISVALALGNNTPLYQIFYKIFPFFRFPEKFMFLASFSLVVMAAYGVDQFICLFRPKKGLSILISLMLFLILFSDLYFANHNLNPTHSSSLYQKEQPSLRPILEDSETFRIYSEIHSIPFPSLPKTILNHHLTWQGLLMPNLGILNNLYHVDGTNGLELIYQYLTTEILLRPWREKIRFLKLANVKYIITSENLDKDPDLVGHVERMNAIVFRINDYLPRAWMVGQLLPIRKSTIDELVDGSFDPANTAISNAEIVSKYNIPFFKNVDKITYTANNRIHIELTAEDPSLLVISESSYPGWKVSVDGKEEELIWLNLLYQGVEIDRGKHSIEFIYRPKNFNVYLLISLIAVAAFLILWLFQRRTGLWEFSK